MAFTEDLSIFFNTSDHAITATYTPFGYPRGGSKTENFDCIKGLEYKEFNGVSGEFPTALGAVSNFARLRLGDQIVMNGTFYKLKHWEPDGTGLVLLVLEDQE